MLVPMRPRRRGQVAARLALASVLAATLSLSAAPLPLRAAELSVSGVAQAVTYCTIGVLTLEGCPQLGEAALSREEISSTSDLTGAAAAGATESRWGTTTVASRSGYAASMADGRLSLFTASVEAAASGSGGAIRPYCAQPTEENPCRRAYRARGDADADLNVELNLAGASSVEVTVQAMAAASGPVNGAYDGSAHFEVSVACEGEPIEGEGRSFNGVTDGEPNFAVTRTLVLEPGDETCSLELSVASGSRSFGAETPVSVTGEAVVTVTLVPRYPGGSCAGADLEGIVVSGDQQVDGHADPMAGILLDLIAEGAPVGDPVATDADGRFCFPAPAYQPGPYTLRAYLLDAAHERPLFETRVANDTAAFHVDTPVSAATWGTDLVVTFTKSGTDAPAYAQGAEAAAIHRNAARFLDWLISAGIVPEAVLADNPVIFRSHVPPAPGGKDFGAVYYPDNRHGGPADRTIAEIKIGLRDSAWGERNEPWDYAPENAEWHELGHHAAYLLGIATECAGQVNHGGWANHNTCDSLKEGAAIFLAVAGSQAIDAERVQLGYATSAYGGFGDLEADRYRPWTYDGPADNRSAREDFAVAELLLDLADGPDGGLIVFGEGVAPQAPSDRLALGAPELMRLLAEDQSHTVTSIHEKLQVAPTVAEEVKVPSIPLFGPEEGRISALDAVFLAHGFHPVFDPILPSHRQGQPVGRTDHDPTETGLVARRHIDPTEGSAIRVVNASGELRAVVIDLAYGQGPTTQFVSPLTAGASTLVPLDLPPVAVPCDPNTPGAITISLAAGTQRMTVDECAYDAAVRAAYASGAEAALTFEIVETGGEGPGVPGSSAAEPTPTAAPTPTAQPIVVAPTPSPIPSRTPDPGGRPASASPSDEIAVASIAPPTTMPPDNAVSGGASTGPTASADSAVSPPPPSTPSADDGRAGIVALLAALVAGGALLARRRRLGATPSGRAGKSTP